MEHLTKGEAITLDNDLEYYVVEVVEEGSERYLYLVGDGDDADVIIAKEIIEGDDILIETLEDQEKIMEIVKIVTERLRD